MTVLHVLRSALLVGLLILGPPRAASAQASARVEAVRAQVGPEVARALVDLTAQAERRGLPADALVDKALEGIAKRVPAPQIVAALRVLVDDLGRAQALLQGAGAVTAPDLVSVAVALRRGAPANGIRRLALGAPEGEPLGVTVQTLADLVQRGVSERDAVSLLLTWRTRGGDPEALRQIPAAIDRLIRDGILPAQAVSAIGGAIQAGLPPISVGPPAGIGPPPGVPRGRPDKP